MYFNFKKKQILKFFSTPILFFLLILSSLVVNGQSIDKTRINIVAKDQKLTKVFEQIENKSNFSIVFTEDIGAIDNLINLNLKEVSIKEIFSELQKQVPISYLVNNKSISVKKKESTQLNDNGSKTINGKVIDEFENPLMGALVRLKGSDIGSVTDVYGNFQLEIPVDSQEIEISFLGYVTNDVRLSGLHNFTVVLNEDLQGLDEVVVIGYGTAKKKDLTGSISTVNGEEIAKRNVTQLSQALQGTMSGVTATRSNSEPGAGATIRVRGITTIGDSDPLIIVDGVPVSTINNINSDNIKDITVLKDAASASIYGARAAAGVILITTKRSKDNKTAFEYNYKTGFDIPTAFPDMVGVQRYLEMINEWTWNGAGNPQEGQYSLYTKDQVDNWLNYNKQNPNQYPVTDWKDLLLNDFATRNSHSISFSSGTDVLGSTASLLYEEVGALYDHKSFERVMGRINNDFTISKKLSALLDVSYSHENREAPVASPVESAQRYAPIYAATWEDGRISDGKNGSNIYARMLHGGYDKSTTNRLNLKMSLKFSPFENFDITGVIAPYLYNVKGKKFVNQISAYDSEDPDQFIGFITGNTTSNLYENRGDGWSITNQIFVNYGDTFNKHKLDLLAGYEGYSSFSEVLDSETRLDPIFSYPYMDLGLPDFMFSSGNASENAYSSFFGRVMYNYDGKYFIQANARYDGSSRFHADYRWGMFPSISAGWVVTAEDFFPKNNVLNYLKLKGSWGQLGNERIGNYAYQSSLNSTSVLFYQGDEIVSSIATALTNYVIPDISWETTETFNIGIEAYLFKNFKLNVDYYKKTTRDMLLELEIPDYIGYGNPNQNTGKMNTKGWDLELSWSKQIKDFSYSISTNLSDYKSKMGELGGIVFFGDQIIKEGTEYNEWYGYVSDGIFQTEEEVNNSPVLHTSVGAGDIKYVDISGPDGEPDGVISPEYDRVTLGGSLPRYVYGGNLNLNYKNFEFSLAFQGVGKVNSRIDTQMVKPFDSQWSTPPALIDGKYWSQYNSVEQNLNAKYPRLSYTSAENNNYKMSDYWMFDGGYFRLKNITIGYTIPKAITQTLKLSNVRLYISGTDIFSIDNYPKGWDPEMSSASYINSTYTLGASIKF